MKLLVDTHCWLWYLLAPEKLNARAQELLRGDESEIYFSAASAWEIVIKHALGKLVLPLPPAEYIPDRTAALRHHLAAIEMRHVLHAGPISAAC